MGCQYCNAIELTLEKKKIKDLKAQVEFQKEVIEVLYTRCASNGVYVLDIELAEAKAKDGK